VVDLPVAGDPPADLTPRVSVAAVCKTAGITATHYYFEAKEGRAPVSKGGLTLDEAKAWLAEHARKKAARAEASRRRKAFLEGRRRRVALREAAAAKKGA